MSISCLSTLSPRHVLIFHQNAVVCPPGGTLLVLIGAGVGEDTTFEGAGLVLRGAGVGVENSAGGSGFVMTGAGDVGPGDDCVLGVVPVCGTVFCSDAGGTVDCSPTVLTSDMAGVIAGTSADIGGLMAFVSGFAFSFVLTASSVVSFFFAHLSSFLTDSAFFSALSTCLMAAMLCPIVSPVTGHTKDKMLSYLFFL